LIYYRLVDSTIFTGGCTTKGYTILHKIVYSTGECEIVEKNSKFFGYCAPAETEAEARAAIAAMRQRHPQAGHYVFAYDIQEAAGGRVTRQSDDGEPHGTAGMPVLTLFTKQEIINFICVVARIFGGVLLGKGGLARAYAAAAKGSLVAAGFGPLIIRRRYQITIPYPDWDKIKYNLDKNNIPIDETDFNTACVATVTVMEEQEEIFRKMVGNLQITGGIKL
jgi:uncharacterized YigZ family protein